MPEQQFRKTARQQPFRRPNKTKKTKKVTWIKHGSNRLKQMDQPELTEQTGTQNSEYSQKLNTVMEQLAAISKILDCTSSSQNSARGTQNPSKSS